MELLDRRLLGIAGLTVGFTLSCYDGAPPIDTEAGTTGTTGPTLCAGNLVTCPDGTCQPPGPGVCCGFGGVCPSDDTGPVDPTNLTTPTSSIGPPATTTGADESTSDDSDSATTTDTTDGSSSSSGSASSDSSSSSSESSSSEGSSSESTSGGSSESGFESVTSTTTGIATTTTTGIATSTSTGIETTTATTTTGIATSTTGFGSTSTTGIATSTTGMVMMLDGCDDSWLDTEADAVCGPDDRPCWVRSASTIDPKGSVRVGPPALAVDHECRPTVLHANASTQSSRLATWEDGTWTSTAHPLRPEATNLHFDAEVQVFRVLVHDGSFGAGKVPIPANAERMVLDYEAWLSDPLGASEPGSAAVVTARPGQHQRVHWSTGGQPPILRWSDSNGHDERVTGLGTYSPSASVPAVDIAVDEARSGTHVLTATATALDQYMQLVYLEKYGPDAWRTTVLASEDPTGQTRCDHTPDAPGQRCTIDRITLQPLAIAASRGGEVRWLYSEAHELVDTVAECTTTCQFVPVLDLSTYVTVLGWLDDGVPQRAELWPDVHLSTADLWIDRAGSMHVVGYAHPVDKVHSEATTVEYYRLAR